MSIDSAFQNLPKLETERLILQQIQPDDAEAYFPIKANPLVTEPYAMPPHQSIEDTQKWIENLGGYYERRETLYWVVILKEKEEVIGSCTFWNFNDEFRCAELGYELDPKHWQKGLMTEAVTAVLEYGFAELNFHRVEACPLGDNPASNAILKKLGFNYEGCLRERVTFRGQHKDLLYYGLLKYEWEQS